jgi:MtN3 and saliva related transmembrane protein
LEERERLGFIGGALTTSGFIPQVRRLFRLRSAHEISLLLIIFFIVDRLLALVRDFTGLPSVVIWTGVTSGSGRAMLYAKLRYGR